jgi:hypothetical protein
MPILGVIASSKLGAPTPAFESIATATGTGSSGTITFSSIPSTYQHLQLRIMSKVTNTTLAGYSGQIRFNGATGAVYAEHYFYASGSAAAGAGNSPSTTSIAILRLSASSKTSSPDMSNIMGVMIMDIHDYASATKNKTLRYQGGVDSNDADANSKYSVLGSGLYNATTPISSIDIITDGGTNFTTSSVFSLYGIKGT